MNETLARRWWPQGNWARDRLVIGRYQSRDLMKEAPREVVGVAADTKTTYLKELPRPTVYIPSAQVSDNLAPAGITWVLRASLSTRLAAELRRAAAEIDPRLRVGRFRPMDEIVAATTADSRFDAWLFGLFAGSHALGHRAPDLARPPTPVKKSDRRPATTILNTL